VAAGVGFVFNAAETDTHRRGGAFAHDAWSTNYRKSRIRPNGQIHECAHTSQSAAQYAASRIAMLGGGSGLGETAQVAAVSSGQGRSAKTIQLIGGERPSAVTSRLAAAHGGGGRGGDPRSAMTPQLAAAYKRHWLNSSWNCFDSRTRWEDALAKQRAFADLLAHRRVSLEEAGLQVCCIAHNTQKRCNFAMSPTPAPRAFGGNEGREGERRVSLEEAGLQVCPNNNKITNRRSTFAFPLEYPSATSIRGNEGKEGEEKEGVVAGGKEGIA
jgi:hypothetical protein